MNYEEISDESINELVAKVANYTPSEIDIIVNSFVSAIKEGEHKELNMATFGIRDSEFPNYCNNLYDAWSIIVENEINIEFQDGGFVNAWVDNDHGFFESQIQKNPLRAAMICFLKMKESDNG